jgi:hypothetical protein
VMVVIWTRKHFLCVACKTLLACITLYDIMLIMLSIYVWMIIISILYAYDMKYAVVPWYPCYIDIILCIFTICHTILSHDYTQIA